MLLNWWILLGASVKSYLSGSDDFYVTGVRRSEHLMRKLIAFILIGVIPLSCSNWVQVTSSGTSVRLLTIQEAEGCDRIGSARAQTLGSVVGLERGAERLQDELSRIARNEAGDMGGNAIVPESVISDGRQSFGVYLCP